MSLFRIMSIQGIRLLLGLCVLSPVAITVDTLLTSSIAQAQSVVREIRVVGNRRVEPETVRSYLQFSVGDPYDYGLADESIKSLFATGLFADIAIDEASGIVTVTVDENPVINQVAFEGNSEVDNDTLRNEVLSKPRSVFTRARVQADVQRILDVYRRQGRFAASVYPQIIELEQNRVNLVFEVVEGTATKVKGISFIGNRAFSDDQLRDIITTTQSGWFDFLKGTAVYDPDRLNLDRELLRQYYLKNGFADAQIVGVNAELDRDGSGFFITFTVEEGELYRFGSVTIESSLSPDHANTMRGRVLTQPGAIYNGSLIDKSVEKLTLSVAEEGYAFVRVRPRAEPDFVERAINLRYVVEEGPRVYIERINIYGNTRTKDYVIRREFRLAEGDAYNPLLVDRAKKRLQGLGIFKDVKVKRTPGSSPDRVLLDVEVVEQSTGELSFGAGYSTSEGVIGDISITERNLLGNGQFLRLKLSGSLERYQIDLSFTEPRFLDLNLAAGFDLFHKEVDQTSTSGFASRRTGGSLRLGFPLAENLWMRTSYTLARDEIFDVDSNASLAIQEAAGQTATSTEDGIAYTSSIGAAISYDIRNHPRNPTRGLYLTASTDFAGVGGDVNYVRFGAEGRAYYPVAEKVTLVGRVIGGHILGWGGDDVRLLDLFFKGGETVRGFERSGFGPRDLNTQDALGGSTYWAATAELRFPIPLVPDELGITGAVFADAGSLFGAGQTAEDLNAGCRPGVTATLCLADDATIRSSVGVSLLWNSPVGPLRVDYAHVLSKEDFDEEKNFRFGASTNF